MNIFLKGVIAGLGGASPGLCGNAILIIFGLYQRMLDALGNLFKNFKENAKFLLPLILGMFTGVLLFSKIINFLINRYEMQSCFCFLGLILGTLPSVWREVKKQGFARRHYVYITISAVVGLVFFKTNPDAFPQVTDPNLAQSILLGVAVAATTLIPGVDPAVFLSTLGLYRVYVASLAEFDLSVLAPMMIGLCVGGVAISYGMSFLFKRFYTATYSVVFGIFLSMIPNMLNERCVLGLNGASVIAVLLMLSGFFVSYFLGKRERESSG